MQTRSKPQPTSRIGRRATPAPPQGRFKRPGRPTPTPPQSRFKRPGRPTPAPPQSRFKRHAPPKPSTSDKAMSALSGVLGGHSASKKGSGRTNRAGKMALLAGGLGLAMKNRGKLMGLLDKRSANRSAQAGAQPSPPPPPPGP
jgi:hypothetical protein